MNASSVFLFAHQDDEFAVYQKIIDELSLGRSVYCLYFTDEVFSEKLPGRRSQESILVLRKLGVQMANIQFPGHVLSISDAELPYHMDRAIVWFENWFSSIKNIEAIYIPAWEGGHHDHDALHAIGVVVSNDFNRINVTRQFPLYNAYKCPSPLFRVLSPLNANGELEISFISYLNRIRFLGYCLSYPSQFVTWIGLIPFVFLHYLFFGTQALQSVSLSRIYERPHSGPLYYERRNFFRWEVMFNCLSSCARLQEIKTQAKFNVQ